MRNALLTGLIVLIIVLAGGTGILWYIQASQVKTNVENTIAAINAKQQMITYESIQTSGFPSNVVVSIVKPHFAGRMDLLLKASLPQPPAAVNQPAPPAIPEWDADLSLDGVISIGVNALSDHYTLGVSGTWHDNSKIGGQSVAMTGQPAGDTVCALQMQHGTGFFDKLWNFNALMNNTDFPQNFRMLDCVFPSHTSVDPTTQEVLVSSAGGRLYVTNAPSGNARQFRFYMKSADAQIMPAGDKIVTAYLQALAPTYPLVMKFSSYGKQNIEIDLAYSGPASFIQPDAKDVPMDVNFAKFIISNQIYNTDMSFHLTNSLSGDNRQTKVTLMANSEFSEQYDTLLQDLIRNLVNQMYLPSNPQYVKMQSILQAYKPDELYATLAPAIPKIHTLGKLTQALDLSYQGSNTRLNGDINLTTLQLSAAPYGITASGSAKAIQGSPIPKLNVTITCTNCNALIDEIADYTNRLQKAVAVFNPAQAVSMHIEPAQAQAMKDFLGTLAVRNTDHTVYSYTIISDGTPNININGKSANDVMAMFNEYVAPTLKHPAPAATPAH